MLFASDNQDDWSSGTDTNGGDSAQGREYSEQEIQQLVALVRHNYRLVRCPRHLRIMECLRLNRVDGRLTEIELKCHSCGFPQALNP